MQMNRHELVRAANRRMRRGKRSTGRIVVSALGFATAYFLDAENGAERRKRLHEATRRALRSLDDALAPDVEGPPVLRPLLRSPHASVSARHPGGRTVAVR